MDVLDQCQTVIIQLPSQSIVYEWLFQIHDFYRPIHTYVSIILCLLGTLCNFCNIVVLTRKQMRTPVNMILTAMACCDTVVLFSNLIYTTHYTFVAFANCHPKHWSYGWAMFLIAHAHLSLVGHSSSVWLSVMLAFIRYLTLRRRGKMTGVQIDLRHSYMAITAVVVFVSVMNAPNFLTYKIMEMGLNETCVITDESVRFASAYVPGVSDMAVEADCLVFRMAFWISGTVFKMLPCIFLTLLVSLLTRILNEVKANRQRLLLRGVSSRITACIPENSTTSNTALSTAVAATTNLNFNTVVPAPAQVQQPAIAFYCHATDMTNSGGNRRHSSYESSPPPSPQLLTISDSQRQKSTSSPPMWTKESDANKCVVTPNTGKRVKCSEHSKLIRSNSAKAIIGALHGRSLGGQGVTGSGGARADRTTRMLLAIVCVFLITEFPQGIMALLSGFFSEEFRRYIYNNVGDILDLLSLCEACTSFIIYCSMSGQFRNEFRRVFLPIRLRRWLAENSRYINHLEQRSNCYPCSDTYINNSRSGGGNGGGSSTIIDADSISGCYGTEKFVPSPCASPFLRPTSTVSVRGANDKDVALTGGGGGGSIHRTPLSERRERRPINLPENSDSSDNYFHNNRKNTSPLLSEMDSVKGDNFVFSYDGNNTEKMNNTNDNKNNAVHINNVVWLNSPASPDIPLILCSDWSGDSEGSNIAADFNDVAKHEKNSNIVSNDKSKKAKGENFNKNVKNFKNNCAKHVKKGDAINYHVNCKSIENEGINIHNDDNIDYKHSDSTTKQFGCRYKRNEYIVERV